MAQFDVYPHPIEELRGTHPYVLQIQSDFIRSADARVTIPLAQPQADIPPMTRLNPELSISGEPFLLDTLQIVSFEPSDLRHPIANLQSQAQAIWDALEYALHGY